MPADSVNPDALGPRFRVEGILGRGGMGVVYRAFDHDLGRHVAVKQISGATNPRLKARLEREGQAMAQLTHAGIVQVHGLGEYAGHPYMVFELVEGARPLQVAWDGVDLRGRVAWLRDVARALGAAHAKGVVHRDVKPDNVLVDAEGRARVTDFGLARVAGTARLTQTGSLLGTPHYMAPEQFRGQRDAVGPHSDVWSLGVLLYQAMTEELPFGGGSIGELGMAIAQATPSPPSAFASDVDPGLERICLRALSGDPARRYPHGAALAKALDAWLAGRAAPAPGPRLGHVMALAGVALLAVVAALGVSSLRGDPPANDSTPDPRERAPVDPPGPSPARQRAEAIDAWRRLQSPLPRYVEGVELDRRWPDAPELAPVRAALLEARAKRKLLTFLEADADEGETWVAFGPGARLWCVAGEDVITWDARSGEELQRRTLTPGAVRERVCVLPSGEALVGGPDLRWLYPDGASDVLASRRRLEGASLDAKGSRLVTARSDGRLEVFDLAERRSLCVLTGDHDPPLSFAISPDGACVAAFVGRTSPDEKISEIVLGELVVWDLPSGDLRLRTEVLHRARTACFTPDGSRVFVGSPSGELRAFDPTTGEPAGELTSSSSERLLKRRGHFGMVRQIVFLGDGRAASIAGVAPGSPNGHQLRLWDLESGEMLWELRPLPRYPFSLSVDEELELIALGTPEGVELYPLPPRKR